MKLWRNIFLMLAAFSLALYYLSTIRKDITFEAKK